MKKFFALILCGLSCTVTIYAQSGISGSLNWEIVGNVLTISGNDAMPDYSSATPPPWDCRIHSAVTDVVIGEGVTSIGNYAFYMCSNITSVVIPSTVLKIGDLALHRCTKLTSVSIPASVTSIGQEALTGCTSLTSIMVNEANANYSSDEGVLFNRDKTTLITFCAPTLGSRYTVYEKVETIADYAFEYCNLTSVKITDMVQSIGVKSFFSCNNLSSVDISLSVETIGDYAFSACVGLSEVFNYRTEPQMISSEVFAGTPVNSCILRVRAHSVEDYHNADVWKEFSIEAITGGITGSLTWEYLDGTLTIRGEGDMPNYTSSSGAPWSDYQQIITKVDIGVNVSSIGSYAFSYTTHLTSIAIPSSVTTIGSWAFCLSGLTSVIIPATVETIMSCAFIYCWELTSVVIPATLSFNGSSQFYDCKKLSEIVNACRTPQILSSDAFYGIDFESCKLWVPVASVNLYKNASVWKEFDQNISAGVSFDMDKLCMMTESTTEIKVIVHTDLIYANNTVYIWGQDKPDVVTRNYDNGTNNCTITAINPGTVSINVFIGGMMEAKCTVTVIDEGTSVIEGTVVNTGAETVFVNLYIKDENRIITSLKKVAGGYILLAKTTTNTNGHYIFNSLPPGDYLIDVEIDDFDSEHSPLITLLDNEIRSGINFTVDIETHTVIQGAPEVTTGTEELTDAVLSIYPNPFADHLYIESAKGCTIRIFSIDGKQVHVQAATNANEIVHLEHLPEGLYIIRVENDGVAAIVKVVKRSQ